MTYNNQLYIKLNYIHSKSIRIITYIEEKTRKKWITQKIIMNYLKENAEIIL